MQNYKTEKFGPVTFTVLNSEVEDLKKRINIIEKQLSIIPEIVVLDEISTEQEWIAKTRQSELSASSIVAPEPETENP